MICFLLQLHFHFWILGQKKGKKEVKDEMKTVKVRGPRGTPVHATAPLDKHGYPTFPSTAADDDDFSYWKVNFSNYPTEVVPQR
jgi:hypothetical protein